MARQSETTTVTESQSMGRRTHQEILERAIQKAIDGGWNYESFGSVDHWLRKNASTKAKAEIVYGNISGRKYEFIFNHEFAKALWPELRDEYGVYSDWRTHLAQMVISDDPIAYLGEHLDG